MALVRITVLINSGTEMKLIRLLKGSTRHSDWGLMGLKAQLLFSKGLDKPGQVHKVRNKKQSTWGSVGDAGSELCSTLGTVVSVGVW